MRPTIAFSGRIGDDERTAWIAALQAALPQAQVVPLADLGDDERCSVTVAIVANPDPAELRTLPNLVWIQSLWAGVERLLQELGDGRFGIVRMEDPQLARSMAQAVLAWTLYLHRDMPLYARQQRERVWKPQPVVPAEAMTVAVLGLGVLGEAAALTLRQNGYRTLGWSRRAKAISGVETFQGRTGLIDVLAAANITAVLLPLTPETRHLLDRAALDAMRPGASLINFARGGIVDTPALLDRLSSGHLRHAVLDVFETEPLPQDDPCWGHPQVTVLPHISAPTTVATASRIAAANIGAYLDSGVIPRTVDRKRGY